MTIVFLSDANGYEADDPYAYKVAIYVSDDVPTELLINAMKYLELKQIGVGRRGGDYREILVELQKMGIESKLLSSGRKSDFDERDQYYKLISGNY